MWCHEYNRSIGANLRLLLIIIFIFIYISKNFLWFDLFSFQIINYFFLSASRYFYYLFIFTLLSESKNKNCGNHYNPFHFFFTQQRIQTQIKSQFIHFIHRFFCCFLFCFCFSFYWKGRLFLTLYFLKYHTVFFSYFKN